MPWKERSPGLYQRPLGAQETPVISSSALSEGIITREPIRIHVFADLSSPNSSSTVVQAFGEAWTALRLLRSPEIAATYQEDQKCYKVASAEELEEWHKKTYRVAPIGTSIEAVVQEMQRQLESLPVLYLIPTSNDQESFKGSLIFFISHWMTEATGAFMIVNQLCAYSSDLLQEGSKTKTALSTHRSGSEVYLLTPTLEEMFQPAQTSSAESVQRTQAHFDQFIKYQPRLDFVSRASVSSDTKPSHMMQDQRIYSPASTAALVAACKSKGISIAAAIHSAYLAAVWQLAPADRQDRPYACIMPAQMRTRLPASSPYREQGCWNSARMLFLSLPANDQDFISRSTSLRKQYMMADDKTWQCEDLHEWNKQTLDYFIKTASEEIALPYITSMGLLDGNTILSQHGKITVEGVCVWADALGLGVVLGQWSFRGRLNLQISWNIAFHESEQIHRTIQLLEEVLRKELGVHLEAENVRKKTF